LESEQILRTVLHIQLQETRIFERDALDKEQVYQAMIRLTRSLNRAGRYEESRTLLSSVAAFGGDIFSMERPESLNYYYEMARMLKLQGRFYESKDILEGLLRSQGITMTPNGRGVIMKFLAETLMLSGRAQEAALWYKEVYLLDTITYGFTHKFGMRSCKDLGYCYAQQKQYDQAIFHFEKTIEKVNLNTCEDPGLRSSCIGRVRRWIRRVESMKTEEFGGSVKQSEFQMEGKPLSEIKILYCKA
jgi:tetratricopeptide (TPR) repeat protein